MSKFTGDVIVDMLEKAGVKHIWGITGDTANYITSAISRSSIRFMHVRHEEAGAFAAGAEAKGSERLSACIGSCGPGSLHLLNGLYDANANGVPVICLATHILKNEIGLDYIQETDPKALFEPCSVFCEFVQSSFQLPRLMASAMQHAISKKGVAVLILPGDIVSKVYDGGDYTNYYPHYTKESVFPQKEDLFQIAELINKSSSMAIIAGEGCKGAHDSIVALSQLRKAAVAWTYHGKQFVEYDNPYAVGSIGKLGTNSVNEAIRSCDLLLQLGSNFSLRDYNVSGKIIQIDANPAALGFDHFVDYAYVGNIKDTLERLLPYINEQSGTCYVEEVLMPYENKCRQYDELYKKKVTSDNEIYSEYVFNLIDKRASQDAAFCADTGSALVLMQRHIHATRERSFYQSARWGSRGNAFPASLGVKASFPDKQVIALCGDGGLSSLLGDLISAIQLDIPVKVLLLNNGRMDLTGMQFYTQNLLPSSIDLVNTDYAAIASAIGYSAYKVHLVTELESAIDRWLDQDKPAFLDVKVASITSLHNGLISKK